MRINIRNARFLRDLIIIIAMLLVMVSIGCQPLREVYSPLASPLFPSPQLQETIPISPSPSVVSSSLWPSGRVLYHSNQTGEYQIYLVVDGGLPVALTSPPGSAVEPSWSPDGQLIAFAAEVPGSEGMSIYTMRPDGTEKRELISSPPYLNWRPRWSPSGEALLFLSNRDGNVEIYKASADGTSLINLTNHPANDLDADWSPDGTRIVFTSSRAGDSGIYVMNADGSGLTKLLDGECAFPHWSPDGVHIVFACTGSGQDFEIYLISADGSNMKQVTNRVGQSTTPAWVGTDRLIFSGEVDDLSWDLFLVNADGSGLVQLTMTQASERFPVWIP